MRSVWERWHFQKIPKTLPNQVNEIFKTNRSKTKVCQNAPLGFRAGGSDELVSSANPSSPAIVTSRQEKRANVETFRNGVVVCGETQCLQAVFPAHFSFKWFCVWIQISNHDLSYLRGKWVLILAKQSFVKFIWRGFVGALEWRVVWENFPCSHDKFAFFWRSVWWRNLKRDLKKGYL